MALPQPQNTNDDEQLPLTPELIEKINGVSDEYGLNRSQKRQHSRLVAGLRSKHQSGVIVTVVESDGSVCFYQVKKFMLGPTE